MVPPRSFAGPIVLIIIGLVFLALNLGMIGRPTMFRLFADYWPLLIILWGVIKLFEYQRDRNAGFRPRGIGFGGFVLLFFLIMFGLAASGARHVNWNRVSDEIEIDDNVFTIFGERYDFTQNLEQELPANAQLKLNNDRGAITVNPSPDNKLRITVAKQIVAGSRSEAEDINRSMEPEITIVGNVVNVNVKSYRKGSRLNFDVQVPASVPVELLSLRGDLTVLQRQADVKAHASVGDIRLEEIKGNVDVHFRHGDLVAHRIDGDVAVEGRGGETDIADVTGAVELRGTYGGPLHFARIGKELRFKSTRTDLQFAKLDGELTVSNDEMTARQFAGPTRLRTRSYRIRFEEFSGDLGLENANGDVLVRPGRAPVGNITIDNGRGDVELVLPSGANFTLDARSRRGDINSSFDGLKVDSSGRDSSATGTIGSGGAKVNVNTDTGAIDIRKG
jgi:DUF4097 and DUF4098 domain-containing protein YvlB